MTTVDDILQLIEPSDRLRIVKDGKDLFVGYVGAYKLDSEKQLQDTFGSCEVKKFRAVPAQGLEETRACITAETG